MSLSKHSLESWEGWLNGRVIERPWVPSPEELRKGEGMKEGSLALGSCHQQSSPPAPTSQRIPKQQSHQIVLYSGPEKRRHL